MATATRLVLFHVVHVNRGKIPDVETFSSRGQCPFYSSFNLVVVLIPARIGRRGFVSYFLLDEDELIYQTSWLRRFCAN